MTIRLAAGTSALGRFFRNPLAAAAAGFLAIIVVIAATAQFIAPMDPNYADLRNLLAAPNPQNLLGTDRAGRDLLSRLMVGTQITLFGSAFAVTIALSIGVPSGLVAGYYRRWFETVSIWISGMLMAMPSMIVLLAVRAVAGPSIWTSMAVFGVLLAPTYVRLVRSSVISVRKELYVDAARVSGLSDMRIIFRHVLGVVRAPIIVQSALVASLTIAVQSGLEFLGIGDRQVPTWGRLLNEAFEGIYTDPILMVWPASAVFLTCVSLGILANGIRDALEDRDSASAPSEKVMPGDRVVTPVRRPSPISTDSVLSIRGLRIGYPQAEGGETIVVNGVDLDIAKGEILGLVGESGTGKSQTAFSILGLLPRGGRIVEGEIYLLGECLTALGSRALASYRGTKIAYIPQEPLSNLDPAYTVGHQLIEPMRVRLGLSKAQATETALALLDRVGIRDPRRTFSAYPHELSGGMAQRVLIAGAVSCQPALLIADEPTTALDVTVQAKVLELLRDLQRDLDMAMLLVTHNLGIVADICDRVAVMKSGRIVETADVETLFSSPKHEYTQLLLSSTLDDAAAREPFEFASSPV
jgi:ABC-type dipeptide/oligopeptide/nickel transport system ATPase component/ABC-type dipeptide/oligopeptide/nickel transport system permease subunit